MNRKYFAWVVAFSIISAILIIIFVVKEETKEIPQAEITRTSVSPYKSYIFGLGIVEPISGNISIGSSMNRIVDKVKVTVGMKVQKGDILFCFDDRDLESDLVLRQVEYEIALEKLKKLESLPRHVDTAPSEEALKNAAVELDQAKDAYEMAQGLEQSGALSRENFNRRKFNYQKAEASFLQAKAELEKIKAGTWQPDLEISFLETKLAKANVEKIKTEIEKTIIRSPIDGTVLQIKIQEGELPPPDSQRYPMMILGNLEQMYIRVSINQFDAPYFRPDSKAVAFLQGESQTPIPLEFIRLEPYLVNKQNLTNELTEQVDTRVLQVIYKINSDRFFYVEQQMDVFIQTEYPKQKKKVKKA